jgi:hypothetical protein
LKLTLQLDRVGEIEKGIERGREGERDIDTRSSHVCVYTSSLSHYVSDIHSHSTSTHQEFACVIVWVFERERERERERESTQQNLCVYMDCNTVCIYNQTVKYKIKYKDKE